MGNVIGVMRRRNVCFATRSFGFAYVVYCLNEIA